MHRPNTLRIIAGRWRGRKLTFPALAGIRPTPDRVRETVFNWLAPVIHNAHCLDLFAGSGALGFEALSRGARHCVFVDKERAIISYLQQQLALLQAEHQATLYQALVPDQLPLFTAPVDIVFLDPPFYKNILAACCAWLETQPLLAKNALIYIEAEADLEILPLPVNWQLLRSKKTGQIGYHLAQRSA